MAAKEMDPETSAKHIEARLKRWISSVGTVTLPLLAGFSITSVVVVVGDDPKTFRWPGATVLVLALAAVTLVVAVQCAYHAQVMGANLPRRRPAAGQEPVRRSDDGEARLWHLGTALAVSFTVAVVDLAGLAWPAWFLLGVAGYRHNGRLRSRELACTKPLVNIRSPLYQVNSQCIETDRRFCAAQSWVSSHG